MTTDGFIVQPLEFPGGDIGSLAINGTVNVPKKTETKRRLHSLMPASPRQPAMR